MIGKAIFCIGEKTPKLSVSGKAKISLSYPEKNFTTKPKKTYPAVNIHKERSPMKGKKDKHMRVLLLHNVLGYRATIVVKVCNTDKKNESFLHD